MRNRLIFLGAVAAVAILDVVDLVAGVIRKPACRRQNSDRP